MARNTSILLQQSQPMKNFKIKDETLGYPKEGTSHDLAKFFLGVHGYWFTDAQNSMYGEHTRQACYEALINYMEFDKEDDSDTNLVYCLAKFKSEFFNEYEETCEKDCGMPK
jgi:hypothetical protein